MKWSVEIRKEGRREAEVVHAASLEEIANFVAMQDDCSSFQLVSEIGNPGYYMRILERRVAELRQAMALLCDEPVVSPI
jgi:hypothetical protein